MSTADTAKKAAAKPTESKSGAKKTDGKREKRTIMEIRESKRTGEKMVYMSVPDYTSRNGRKWPASTLRCSATAWR